MGNFDTIFEEFQISNKAENTMKEFSNWLFGISIGLCALLISLADNLYTPDSERIKMIYVTVLALSMLNVLLTGITKYLMFLRETRLMIIYGSLKKIAMLHQTGKDEFKLDREKWDKYFNDWAAEYNKLKTISKCFNATIIMNIITTIITGLSIIIIVI